MFYWDYILLLAGGCHLAFTSGPQPRFSGLMLVLTAALGMGLREYEDLWVIQGVWHIGSAVYIGLNVVVIALSPAQLLLLLLRRDAPKPKTGIVIHHPKPEDSIDKIYVDIVAVHGLGSNPDWAWKHEASDVMWLKDLLPKAFPGARIMAFNHNSRWDIDAAVKSVENCGKELLDTLNLERKGTLQKRPIIFIGHSFGGIIIKKALVTAGEKNNDPRYKDLENSVAGIIFLGVPHDGSRLTVLGKLMSYGTYWLGSSTELLESLEPGAQPLRELNDKFLGGYQDCNLASFWEKSKTMKWGVPFLLAVDQNSGTIPGRTKIGLDADHVGMNKFESEEDNNYKLVKDEIERMVKNALPKLRPAPDLIFNAAAAGDEIKVQECLRNGIDVGSKNRDGLTALHLACATSHGNVVKVLLKEGADVHALSGIGQTPLYHAAQKGHIDIVELLLEYGADVEFSQWNAWAPIHTAAYNGRIDMVKFLVEKGAKIEAKACDGQTALKLARLQENQALVDILQHMGARN